VKDLVRRANYIESAFRITLRKLQCIDDGSHRIEDSTKEPQDKLRFCHQDWVIEKPGVDPKGCSTPAGTYEGDRAVKMFLLALESHWKKHDCASTNANRPREADVHVHVAFHARTVKRVIVRRHLAAHDLDHDANKVKLPPEVHFVLALTRVEVIPGAKK
jgi:hypothetical protein